MSKPVNLNVTPDPERGSATRREQMGEYEMDLDQWAEFVTMLGGADSCLKSLVHRIRYGDSIKLIPPVEIRKAYKRSILK